MVDRAVRVDAAVEKPEVVLSVVLPAFRDAVRLTAHVPVLQTYLRTLGIPFQIVICDDGSEDGGLTRAVAEELGCEYVAHTHNRGKGAALRSGMRLAAGRYRLFTDAEVPYEPQVIGQALEALESGSCDVVAGDRYLEPNDYFPAVSAWRRAGSAVWSQLAGRLIATGGLDTQCGMKAFRAEVADDLFGVSRLDRFAIDVELLYLARQRRYRVRRLPVRLRCQEGSSVRLVRDGLGMLWDLLRIRWNHALGRYRGRRRRPAMRVSAVGES